MALIQLDRTRTSATSKASGEAAAKGEKPSRITLGKILLAFVYLPAALLAIRDLSRVDWFDPE